MAKHEKCTKCNFVAPLRNDTTTIQRISIVSITVNGQNDQNTFGRNEIKSISLNRKLLASFVKQKANIVYIV